MSSSPSANSAFPTALGVSREFSSATRPSKKTYQLVPANVKGKMGQKEFFAGEK
jgi:hypothetical protein